MKPYRYRVSTRTVRKACSALEADGVLERHVRTYRFKAGPPAAPESLVILVTRCDISGRLLLSPFHASAWSQQRLEGLRNRILKAPGARVTAVTDDSHASPWSFQEEAWRELRAENRALAADAPKVLRRENGNLARRVGDMLEGVPPATEATAWVCVNDEVAEIVYAYLRTRDKQPAPYLISFDNSSASYRLGIDSFAFDSGAMARKMLFHLTRPSAALFPGRGLIDLDGRVERK